MLDGGGKRRLDRAPPWSILGIPGPHRSRDRRRTRLAVSSGRVAYLVSPSIQRPKGWSSESPLFRCLEHRPLLARVVGARTGSRLVRTFAMIRLLIHLWHGLIRELAMKATDHALLDRSLSLYEVDHDGNDAETIYAADCESDRSAVGLNRSLPAHACRSSGTRRPAIGNGWRATVRLKGGPNAATITSSRVLPLNHQTTPRDTNRE